jgi:hypothetical protein
MNNKRKMKKKNEDRGFMRVVEGVNSSVIYLIHCKKLCKCHTVPPPSTIKEKNLKKKKTQYKRHTGKDQVAKDVYVTSNLLYY